MLQREFTDLKRSVCSLPTKLNYFNSPRLKLGFNFWTKTSAEIGKLFFLIKKLLLSLISNQTKSSTRGTSLIRTTLAFLVLALYLFVSPNMAVKATREEKVLADQTKKTVVITSEIIADKIPNFLAPVHGYISTYFSSFHPGIDIPNPIGTPVAATDKGVVTFAGWTNSGHGNLVIVTHNLGFVSYYAHLSTIKVKLGQSIASGEVIGNVGSTGNSTGAHLHFEIHQNGVALNPLKFIQP